MSHLEKSANGFGGVPGYAVTLAMRRIQTSPRPAFLTRYIATTNSSTRQRDREHAVGCYADIASPRQTLYHSFRAPHTLALCTYSFSRRLIQLSHCEQQMLYRAMLLFGGAKGLLPEANSLSVDSPWSRASVAVHAEVTLATAAPSIWLMICREELRGVSSMSP